MSKANEIQVGADHYRKHGKLQHWDVVAHFKLDYFQGQVTKYVMRWKDKNGVQDLRKAEHFLQKYIELAMANLLGDYEYDAGSVPPQRGKDRVRPARGKKPHRPARRSKP